ncbi:SAM-dependent methyltransferase [Rhizobium sp. SG_E_25_P2]|jgi:SAM-dependent methyltransferase|uniref:class I SAM-dependent methyltransferase n=1 Tax=Rhizobium sp. SG_E_25_P2 TaxID=2879942 RepID=UPI00247365BB|nr:class I SAM-dependent methyltransferase [Rhizobium sp. SG_E_25_P2]MDH6265089.1 SAM-dependent methyltransferase [Rhizobium sp. SG_E_25_P2]
MNDMEYIGFCPICEAPARFKSTEAWYREHLFCMSCENGSLPRERALASVLNEIVPDWRNRRIHECSPIWRGISLKLAREGSHYLSTQFFPEYPTGEIVNGFRNEDLQKQTFPDESFDIVVALDVMEHVFRPQDAVKEIWRTLSNGGVFIATWPISNRLVQGMRQRAIEDDHGQVKMLEPAVYHETMIGDGRSLVTVDYGYDVHKSLAQWAPFDVRILRFHDEHQGIIGDYTDVIVCRKREAESGYVRLIKKAK